jgi:5-methylcytosine-specific restriction endonuclease McrA
MEIDKEKLEKGIVNAKRWISCNYHKQEKELIGLAEKYNSEVCLAVANFQCQKCGSDKDLTIHHLIMRKAKEFMDFWRYASSRYYWSNQIVLCTKCHKRYHGILGGDEGEKMLVISKEKIDKIKEKYLIQKNI